MKRVKVKRNNEIPFSRWLAPWVSAILGRYNEMKGVKRNNEMKRVKRNTKGQDPRNMKRRSVELR